MYAGPTAAIDAAESQRTLLHQIVRDADKYSGLIVAPFKTENLRDGFAKLLKRPRTFPVATIDKAYSRDDQVFSAEHVTPPAGCVCDGKFNGGLAATSIIDYLRHAEISEPNVVVLQGQQGSDERILGFMSQIARHNEGASEVKQIHLSVSTDIQFLAGDAAEKANEYITTGNWSRLNDPKYMALIKNPAIQRHGRVDAFFCCNDEMALGVSELLEKLSSDPKAVQPTVVVGFDAIAAVRRKIRDHDPWMLNTVDVRVMEQVRLLVDAFDDALRTRRPVADVGAIRGKLEDKNQTAHVEAILRRRRPVPTSQTRAIPAGIAVPAAPE